MRRLLIALVIVVLAVAAAKSYAGGIQLPRLVDPPPPRQQVAEAQIWDPYPVPDLAPYNDGSRPRDFLYPPPKVTRGRQPEPGTFPRPNPQVRSAAPADYPNLKKWWWKKRQAKAAAAAEPIQPAQPAEEVPPALR